MNAAVITAFDRPPQYGALADPVAGPGELLVDVIAVGLHHVTRGRICASRPRQAASTRSSTWSKPRCPP